jgi:hypothetical protein
VSTSRPSRPPTFEGSYVTLRAIDPESDAEDYYASRPGLGNRTAIMTDHQYLSVTQVQLELERLAAVDNPTLWAIVDKETGSMEGWVFLRLEKRDQQIVAGFGHRHHWMDPDRKGEPPCSNALLEVHNHVTTYAFESLQANSIETACWHDYQFMQDWLRLDGFELYETRDGYDHEHDTRRKRCHFRLTREAWLASTAEAILESA